MTNQTRYQYKKRFHGLFKDKIDFYSKYKKFNKLNNFKFLQAMIEKIQLK